VSEPRAYDPEVLAQSLRQLAGQPISPAEKGFTALPGVSADDVVKRSLTVRGGDLTYPLMVARESALTSNVATMAAWCRKHRVEIAPHGKTTMSPEITARQLEAGAWGITAAHIGQVRAYVDIGVRRVLLANELVDPAGIGWLASALSADPGLTFVGYVDSVEGVALLDRELTARGASRPLPVLVELGVPGKRTGARSAEAAVAVARAAAATSTLDVVGATGYEGVLGHSRSAEGLAAAGEFCAAVRALGLELSSLGLVRGTSAVGSPDGLVLSAGGSTYFDVVAEHLTGEEPATVVIRSGGYVTHDDGLYSDATPLPTGGVPYALQAALDVWAYVLSRPEPGLALVGAGRRDFPFDVAWPVVRSAYSPTGDARAIEGATVTGLNDQHGFVEVPESSDLQVGDAMCFGIAHPCTAFDKWRLVPIVDDDGAIVELAHTLF
jgi:D-serine deaminase-like pyridoxal phosphate-dependent protein